MFSLYYLGIAMDQRLKGLYGRPSSAMDQIMKNYGQVRKPSGFLTTV